MEEGLDFGFFEDPEFCVCVYTCFLSPSNAQSLPIKLDL